MVGRNMQKKGGGRILGVPQEETQWCEKKQKYVVHTYRLHPVLNKRFEEFCKEGYNCACECEFKYNI